MSYPLALSALILPEHGIAVGMNSAFGHARNMRVLEMNGVLEKIGWKQVPVDFLCQDMLWWGTQKTLLAVHTPALLLKHILIAHGLSLSRCQRRVVYGKFHTASLYKNSPQMDDHTTLRVDFQLPNVADNTPTVNVQIQMGLRKDPPEVLPRIHYLSGLNHTP